MIELLLGCFVIHAGNWIADEPERRWLVLILLPDPDFHQLFSILLFPTGFLDLQSQSTDVFLILANLVSLHVYFLGELLDDGGSLLLGLLGLAVVDHFLDVLQ